MNETDLSIQAAFIKVYGSKPYEKMSVREVCEEAPAARTTFYEHYENLGDVKSEIEDRLVNGILKMAERHHIEDRSKGPSGFLLDVMDYFKSNWDVNYAFLISQPNFDYMEKWKSGIKYDFKLRFPEKVNMPNYGLVSEVIASGVLGAYIYWMKHPDEVSDRDVLKMVLKAMDTMTEAPKVRTQTEKM